MNAAKTAVTDTLDNIKSAFSEKIEAARSAVAQGIENIKNCFKFEWSLPKLKLPHISITGNGALIHHGFRPSAFHGTNTAAFCKVPALSVPWVTSTSVPVKQARKLYFLCTAFTVS